MCGFIYQSALALLVVVWLVILGKWAVNKHCSDVEVLILHSRVLICQSALVLLLVVWLLMLCFIALFYP
jgi:hypothetical protein